MVGDIRIKDDNGEMIVIKRNVAAGTLSSINNGEPTIAVDAAAGGANPYLGTVSAMATDGNTTSNRFTGVAKSVSTETVAAAGIVYCYLPLPGIIYSAKAKLSTLANTTALIDALKGKRVFLDLTAGVWTVDTASADAKANAVIIVDGDAPTSTVHFIYAHHATFLDYAVSA